MEWLNQEQVTDALQKGTQTLVKHSPKLLTAVGIAGAFTSIIFAVKAKDKADLLINEALEIKKSEAGDDPKKDITLTPFEKVKAVTPAYWPTAVMFVLSSAAIIGSDVISDKRQVTLTAAYTIADSSLRELQKKTLEKIGDKKKGELEQSITQDRVDKKFNTMPNDVRDKSMIFASNHTQYSMFMAPITKQLFFAKIDDVKAIFPRLNERINSQDEITLNDILYDLSCVAISTGECGYGVEENKEIGNIFYWNLETGLINYHFVSAKVPGTDICCLDIVIDTDYKAAINPVRIADTW